jgi:hypothetical protein
MLRRAGGDLAAGNQGLISDGAHEPSSDYHYFFRTKAQADYHELSYSSVRARREPASQNLPDPSAGLRMASDYGGDMHTAILSLVLGLSPPSTSPRAFDVSDTEIKHGADSIHLAAFAVDGDQSAEVVIWADTKARVHVDANFADGLYLSALVNRDGELLAIESDQPEEAAKRMTAIGDFIGINDPQESEVMCLAGVIAASGCVVGNIIGCMGGGLLISCHCLPLLGDYPPGCGW